MPPYTNISQLDGIEPLNVSYVSRSYNYKVDIFAVGCIMAELFTMSPLFPGENSVDQFKVMTKILG